MFETLFTLASNIPIAAAAAVSAGLLRNVAGWIENAWKDGEVESYEWKQLAGTMVKYFAAISLLMFGLPLGESIAATFILDVGAGAVKSLKE